MVEMFSIDKIRKGYPNTFREKMRKFFSDKDSLGYSMDKVIKELHVLVDGTKDKTIFIDDDIMISIRRYNKNYDGNVQSERNCRLSTKEK